MRPQQWQPFLRSIMVISLLFGGTLALAQDPGRTSATPAATDPADGRTLPPNATDDNLLTDIQAIGTKGSHTCALSTNGGVKCWGNNSIGQLGDGTTTDRYRPVDVIGLSSDVQTIAAGGGHTCALTASGGVKCWGANASGQLGDGTTTNRSTPIDVIGLSSGVQAISAGYSHTCALTTDGWVQCWGDNTYGQLSDGTTTDRLTPVYVSGLVSRMQAIAAGGAHTCALSTDGGIKCWGRNNFGQLGDGTTTERLAPVDVSGLSSGVQAIDAGAAHTCALSTNGGAKCWGWNHYGQLGDGTNTHRSIPVDVSGLNSGGQAIKAGYAHTCALTTDGAVKCWGANESGQLGADGVSSRTTPADVSGLTSGAQAIATGSSHTCALMASGGVKCWGDNGSGQLGDGTGPGIIRRHTPTDVAGLDNGMQSIAAGDEHACAAATGDGARCWGSNGYGQLGDGTNVSRWNPANTGELGDSAQAMTAGQRYNCVLTTGGGVKCWGWNEFGQLGDGTTTDRWTPVNVRELGSGVRAVDAGRIHTCALTTDGGAKCWGWNRFGQLGDGTTKTRKTPVDVIGWSSGVQAIAAGNGHTCLLTADGGVKCWGYNDRGQLGDGTTTDHMAPADVSGLAGGVRALALGYSHTCVLTTSGGVKCWGYNASGQLGDGTTVERWTPVDVAGLQSGIQAIAAGSDSTCALSIDGGVKCWGYNSSGQLGDGTTNNRVTPMDVSGLQSGVQAIAVGETHSCALIMGGGVKCWGFNRLGQIGVNPGWTPLDVVAGVPPVFLPLIAQ